MLYVLYITQESENDSSRSPQSVMSEAPSAEATADTADGQRNDDLGAPGNTDHVQPTDTGISKDNSSEDGSSTPHTDGGH